MATPVTGSSSSSGPVSLSSVAGTATVSVNIGSPQAAPISCQASTATTISPSQSGVSVMSAQMINGSVTAAALAGQTSSLSDVGFAQQRVSTSAAMSNQAVAPTSTGLFTNQSNTLSSTTSALVGVSQNAVCTVSSSVNASSSTTANQAPTPSLPSPLAVQFPKGKICRMQFHFPALGGPQTVTDNEDIFIGQLEKEDKMDELYTLNQSFKVTTVTVNASAGVITVKKKGRMSQEGVKRWMEDVRGKIMTVIGTVKSEVLQIGPPSEEIHRSVLANFFITRASCLLSQDKQSLLIVSTDGTEVIQIKDFVTVKLQDTKGLKAHSAPAAVAVTQSSSFPPVIQPVSPASLSLQAAVSPTHPGSQSIATATNAAPPPASGPASPPASAPPVTSSHAKIQVSGPTSSTLSAPVTASPLASPSGGSIHVTQTESRLLSSDKVSFEFLAELMSNGIIIDVSTIPTGNITVNQGDPAKVMAIVKSLICTSSLAAKENDSDVSKELQVLVEKFPKQIESDYDKNQGEYIFFYHRSVEAEVSSAIQKLKNVQKVIPIPTFKANFLQQHVEAARMEIQSSLQNPVMVDITTNSQGQPMVSMLADRRGFPAAQRVVAKVLADLQQKEEEVDGALVLHLQGVKGQKAVQAIEMKHVCQVTVKSPHQQIIMQVTTPKGQQLMVCEGNMAVSDCQMIVIPLLDGQTQWPKFHKHMLERGFLTTNIELYFTEVGHQHKNHTMVLQCHGVAAGQRVVIVSLPTSASDKKSKKRIQAAFKEAVATASYPKASIALPLRIGPDITVDESLKCILPTVKEYLEKGDNSGTVVLYTDSMPEPQLVKMKNAIQQSMLPQWDVQDHMGLHETLGDANLAASKTKKPAVCIVGQQTNVTKALDAIKKISAPEKYQKLFHMLETLQITELTVELRELCNELSVMSETSPPQSMETVSARPVSEFTTMSGIKISVYKTDITKLPVDAIVNAANGHLAHGGGVAAAIARAAGPALEEEGDVYLRKNGPLKVTEVLPTTAGAMSCKKVLHAVGPRWDDYQDKAQCQQDLEETVFNCLKTAHSLQFSSLALSSISSAIFGVPRELCAQVYLSAVKSFDQQYGSKTSLTHIHFVDVSDIMVSIIQETFSKGFSTAVSSGVTLVPLASPQQQPAQTRVKVNHLSGNGGAGCRPKIQTLKLEQETLVGCGPEQSDVIKFRISSFNLFVQLGTFLDVKTEALLLWQIENQIMSDSLSSMFGHVHAAFANEYVPQLRQKKPQRGDIKTTMVDSTLLVLPIMTPDRVQTPDIHAAVLNALIIANEARKGSIAIPRFLYDRKGSKDEMEMFTEGVRTALMTFMKLPELFLTDIFILDQDEKSASFLGNHFSQAFAMLMSLKEDKRVPFAPHSQQQPAAPQCSICLESVREPKTLEKCGHTFCTACIDKSFQMTRPACPECQTLYGIIKGNQPENGKMKMHYEMFTLPGYPPGILTITYDFPSGTQTEEHPNPGRRYSGAGYPRKAYLPDTPEGRKVLMLLKVAFDRRLIFTVGQSATTGQTDVVTWNDIHHKTNWLGGPQRFGYPDDGYLSRVQEELAAKGVTEKDLTDTQKDFIQNPKPYIKYERFDFSKYFSSKTSR
ncbi:hypothetical protein BaRGS_00035713 [Batillaria attramentaria]|uniref:RING-type E3 ubiquitin transferase n=1 Tax=Batillaria attramentaria TaxID=370345 RepID=A0ABD0JDM4_9CAEN